MKKNIIVLKLSGKIIDQKSVFSSIIQKIVLLAKSNSVIIVHGGQEQISRMAKDMNIEVKFVNGQRYTDEKMLELVQYIFAVIRNNVVNEINNQGGHSIGLCGVDGDIILAKQIHTLGYVGKVTKVNPGLLKLLISKRYIPVISPLGKQGSTLLNINADNIAASIAISLKADKLIFMSEIGGVVDKDGNLISTLHRNKIRQLISDGTVTGGMIPKLEACYYTLLRGVKEINITNSIRVVCRKKRYDFVSLQGTRILR